MLKTLGLSALGDLIGVLKQEKNFFSLDEKIKHELLSKKLGNYPTVFVDYLKSIQAEAFLEDLKNALDVFDQVAYANPNNGLVNALAHYLSESFAEQFDELHLSFFFAPATERQQKLQQLFPGESFLDQTLKDLVFQSTYQEVGMWVNLALTYIKQSPVVVVQTPMELNYELKSSIRSSLLEKYPFSFPEFQVNPKIVGGMRVFAGGKVIDHSWMGRIQSLTRLKV